jgi:hypothetical protein
MQFDPLQQMQQVSQPQQQLVQPLLPDFSQEMQPEIQPIDATRQF